MRESGPWIDFLMLADRAEVVGGKLYMMGGGWEVLNLRSIADVASFGIAVGILVPWNATNTDHSLVLRMEDADGRETMRAQAGFRTGRPPHIDQGAEQRVMFVIPVGIVFPSPGNYVVVGAIGEDERRVRLRVLISPNPGMQQQP